MDIAEAALQNFLANRLKNFSVDEQSKSLVLVELYL